MTDIVFYNVHGEPIAYSENARDIYLFSGKCAAYFDKESVYSYSGQHLGWFEEGWIRDNHGYCVFFTKDAHGGPMRPMRGMRPMKSLKQMKPMMGIKQMRPMKSMKSINWSPQSNESFFQLLD